MTLTQQRVLLVLERIADHVKLDLFDAEIYSNELEDLLDFLLEHDFFGTEGWNDPRGDMRNGQWNMERVEGIDEA